MGWEFESEKQIKFDSYLTLNLVDKSPKTNNIQIPKHAPAHWPPAERYHLVTETQYYNKTHTHWNITLYP